MRNGRWRANETENWRAEREKFSKCARGDDKNRLAGKMRERETNIYSKMVCFVSCEVATVNRIPIIRFVVFRIVLVVSRSLVKIIFIYRFSRRQIYWNVFAVPLAAAARLGPTSMNGEEKKTELELKQILLMPFTGECFEWRLQRPNDSTHSIRWSDRIWMRPPPSKRNGNSLAPQSAPSINSLLIVF